MSGYTRYREFQIRDKQKSMYLGLAGWDYGRIGEIHTRGKYAAGDTTKCVLVSTEAAQQPRGDRQEAKGLFIQPYTYGVASENVRQDIGTVWRTYFHQHTWVMEFNDDRVDDHGNPIDTSFDFFTGMIDTFIELYDLEMNLGFQAGSVYHTLLRSQEPLYDHHVDDLGTFHIGKFLLETRVLQTVVCAKGE